MKSRNKTMGPHLLLYLERGIEQLRKVKLAIRGCSSFSFEHEIRDRAEEMLADVPKEEE